MQQRSRRTPKQELLEYGLRLLNDAENSNNPGLIKLRTEVIRKLFDAHLRGEAKVSPRLALVCGIPILLSLTAVCIYCVLKFGAAIAVLVILTCLLFGLVILVLLLALSGTIPDTAVTEIIIRMYEKTIGRLWKANTPEPPASHPN